MKKIGILGSGAVAKTLGSGFIKHGYSVKLGTRDTAKLADWKEKAGANATVGSFEEAAVYGDIVVLAVLGEAAEEVIRLAGENNLVGKTVIDTTNPIDHTKPPVNGVLGYFTTLDESLLERLQKQAPKANFVKAFSCTGNPFMVNPKFSDGKPTMFICGNSDEAKEDVRIILDLFGWETEDMGKVEGARAIEPLCMLWCIPGFLRNQWTHAFKLVKV
jgi:predicted dinucleotide-binding enzyme